MFFCGWLSKPWGAMGQWADEAAKLIKNSGRVSESTPENQSHRAEISLAIPREEMIFIPLEPSKKSLTEFLNLNS